jgi:hypothetical protein
VSVAVTACEEARNFAVGFGRDQLLSLTTTTGDFFTLQTDPEAICEIYPVPPSSVGDEYKFGNELGTLPPSDSCVWDGALEYSDGGQPEEFDGTFFVRP